MAGEIQKDRATWYGHNAMTPKAARTEPTPSTSAYDTVVIPTTTFMRCLILTLAYT